MFVRSLWLEYRNIIRTKNPRRLMCVIKQRQKEVSSSNKHEHEKQIKVHKFDFDKQLDLNSTHRIFNVKR